LSFLLADTGQKTIQHVTVISVPAATADTICSILVVSKSPLLEDPSLTRITNMMMKHKLDAK
jgi:hypothetical protein